MKKQSWIIYIIIGAASFILATILLGPKYGIYDYLPTYHLFEMPNEPEGGNILYEFIRWSLWAILFAFVSFIINSINKNQGFNFIKDIKKAKKNDYSDVFPPLVIIVVLPLLFLLLDYINLSIGTIGKSGTVLPYGQSILFIIWLIFIFYIYKKK